MTIAHLFLGSAKKITEGRGPSVEERLLHRIIEGRMKKAEAEIAGYLQRHHRKLPPDRSR
jgi:hypothetical protein